MLTTQYCLLASADDGMPHLHEQLVQYLQPFATTSGRFKLGMLMLYCMLQQNQWCGVEINELIDVNASPNFHEFMKKHATQPTGWLAKLFNLFGGKELSDPLWLSDPLDIKMMVRMLAEYGVLARQELPTGVFVFFKPDYFKKKLVKTPLGSMTDPSHAYVELSSVRFSPCLKKLTIQKLFPNRFSIFGFAVEHQFISWLNLYSNSIITKIHTATFIHAHFAY